MAMKILLPRLGESIEEAAVGRWCKEIGESMKRGDVIAELETAKAMMELESPVDGVLLAIFPAIGQTIQVGELVAIVGKEGEDWQAELAESTDKREEAKILPMVEESNNQAAQKTEIFSERLRISPNARRVAGENNLDIALLTPKANNERITAADIMQKISMQKSLDASGVPFIEIPLSQIEKITAKRMTESVQTIPQFSISMEVDVKKACKKVKKLSKANGQKITLTALLVKAVAKVLKQHPRINARYAQDMVETFQYVNIAMAVATSRGLYVPVIHQTDKLSVNEIAVRLRELVAKCKSQSLSLHDTEDATFTISNLGMKGVRQFVPIIDLSQSAILGVGETYDSVQLMKDGKYRSRKKIMLTLTCDHRVIDGAGAADFLGGLRDIIESK